MATMARPDGGSGEITARLSPPGRDLSFFFPVDSARRQFEGTIAVSVPYEPIASGIHARTAHMRQIILAGLLILAVTLCAVAASVSRHVRRELVRREEQGYRDPLTGLPNRQQLHDLVHRAIAAPRKSDERVALMLMDLNRFKEINDTLGHHAGDRVLQQLAMRLRSVLRHTETIARLGGDEFAILVPAVRDRAEVVAVAERILRALQEPLITAGLALEVDASIGIALHPDHGDRVAKLLRAADVAMYIGKESLAGYTFFSPAWDRRDGGRRLALIGELRSALEQRQLTLYYQPKVELPSGRVRGVEALARWQHPRGGLLAPDEFIPLLEQSSLLREVTFSLVEMALRDCGVWRGNRFDLKVAVNLSMRNLLDARLPAELGSLIRQLGLTPDCLELELTESMIMSDPERIMRVCTLLRRHGFSLTVDDFGTGYSSLAYLQRLPVSALKIDKSFVAAMDAGDADSTTIVRSTVDLAHNLGLAVVAEGVETETAFNKLTSLGCDLAQGYFVGRPVPSERLMPWLKQQDLPRAPEESREPWDPADELPDWSPV
jgi:diguanylate cyclase (GGDEF)-like protein